MGTTALNVADHASAQQLLSYGNAISYLYKAGAAPALGGPYQSRRPLPTRALCTACGQPECAAALLASRLMLLIRAVATQGAGVTTPFMAAQLDLAGVAAELADRRCKADAVAKLKAPPPMPCDEAVRS